MDNRTTALLLFLAVCAVGTISWVAMAGVQKEAYNDGFEAGFTITGQAFKSGNEYGVSGWRASNIDARTGNITLCKTGTNCCKIVDKKYNQIDNLGC